MISHRAQHSAISKRQCYGVHLANFFIILLSIQQVYDTECQLLVLSYLNNTQWNHTKTVHIITKP